MKRACKPVYLYRLDIEGTSKFYIGITTDLQKRYKSHLNRSKVGKSKLYCAIHKYKSFSIKELAKYENRELACNAEKIAIDFFKANLYNLAEGGDGGFVVVDIESWKVKLRETRKGKTPAKGLKHTEENKELFGKLSRDYWQNVKTYNPEEILQYSHKEAKILFGISTTHYYRLRKQAE